MTVIVLAAIDSTGDSHFSVWCLFREQNKSKLRSHNEEKSNVSRPIEG
jgi:hypothetical protein